MPVRASTRIRPESMAGFHLKYLRSHVHLQRWLLQVCNPVQAVVTVQHIRQLASGRARVQFATACFDVGTSGLDGQAQPTDPALEGQAVAILRAVQVQ